MTGIALSIFYIVFGFISFGLAAWIGISQLKAIFKTHNTSGTSIWTYIIFISCGTIALAWAFVFYFARMSSWAVDDKPFILEQWEILPIIMMYILDLCGSIAMLIVKKKHLDLCKKFKITEIQLSERMLTREKAEKTSTQKKYKWLIIVCAVAVLLMTLVVLLIIFLTNPDLGGKIADFDEKRWRPLIITLSILASVTWELVSWPQLIKCIKTKDTSGISLTWAIVLPVSCVISFAYSLGLAFMSVEEVFIPDSIGGIVFNGMIVNFGVLAIKIRNIVRAKKHKMTEFEFTKKHLNKKEA